MDLNDQESWVNTAAGTVILNRLDHRGEMTRQETVVAGRTFHITTQERRINQEATASEDLDPFKNGMLRPVRLLDGTEDAKELASNPNTMSEEDMRALFRAHHKTFASKVNEIRNPYALERMLKMAGEVDTTVSRVDTIKARLAEISPDRPVEVQAMATGSGRDSAASGRPVTPH